MTSQVLSGLGEPTDHAAGQTPLSPAVVYSRGLMSAADKALGM